jgi:hypothetical protein
VVDPVTVFLATRAVGFFAALAERGADAFGKSVGVATVDKVSEMLASLRHRWAGDKEAATTLRRFQQNPAQGTDALEQLLAARMQDDPQLAAEMEERLNRIGPRLEVRIEGGNIKVVKGPTVGDIRRGTVTTTIKVVKSDQVSGGDYGDVG